MKQIMAMVAGVLYLLTFGGVQADEKNPNRPAGRIDEKVKTELIGGQRVLKRAGVQPTTSKAYWEVLGWGRSDTEAIQDALQRAPQVVAAYLLQQQPPILWQPTPDFIRERMRRGEVIRVASWDQTFTVGAEKVQARAYAVPIAIDSENYRLILNQDAAYQRALQKERYLVVAQDRLLLLLEIVGVTLLGLTAVVLYLHLRGEPKTP